MKGKFKGKILNLRNIIVSLIIVVMATVSGISIVQYNSRNVQTNLGKASKTYYGDNRFGINSIDFVNAAITKLNTPYKWGTYDCWDFVQDSLKTAGASNVEELSNWYLSDVGTITAKDKTSDVNYVLEKIDTKQDVYYNNSEIANIIKETPMGTLFAGSLNENSYATGHGFIYLGYFNVNDSTKYPTDIDKKNAVINWLRGQGIDPNKRYLDTGKINYYSNYDGYWIIDNSSNGVKINNAGWGKFSSGWKTIRYLTLVQVTNPPPPDNGQYKMGVEKIGTDGTKLGGAHFQLEYKQNDKYTIINKDAVANQGTGGNYCQLYEKTDVKKTDLGWHTFRIKETQAPSGYTMDWNNYIYLQLYIEYSGGYKITRIKLSSDGNIWDDYPLTTSSKEYKLNSIPSVTVKAQCSDGNKTENIINFVFRDNKNEEYTPSSYSVNLKKVDENGSPLESKFCLNTVKTGVLYSNNSFISAVYLKEGKETVSPSEDYRTITNYNFGDVVYTSNAKNIDNLLEGDDWKGYTNLRIAGGTEKVLYAEKEDNMLDIYDTYYFSEYETQRGYLTDDSHYELVVVRRYQKTAYVGNNYGCIANIYLKNNGTKKYIGTPQYADGTVTKNTLQLGNASVSLTSSPNLGVNIEIEFVNKRKKGSYNLYIGKKSSYKDWGTDEKHNWNQPSMEGLISGATFFVDIWLNGANPDKGDQPTMQKTITSVDGLWNDGNNITIPITSASSPDKVRITEWSPPQGYKLGKVRRIWLDINKVEEDDKYVIGNINYTFREDNENNIVRTYTIPYGYKITDSQSNVVLKKIDKNLFFIFCNEKQYSLNISKRDKNNNIISSPESGNASFSIKMFKTFSNTNGHISLSDNREIYSNSNIDMNNIKTVDGQISLNNLSIDREWLHKDVKHSYNGESYDAWDFEAKTLYYLITENTPPNGYNSIGSLILGIHFDENGNSSLESLYHVKKEGEGKYSIISTGTNVANSSNLTVNVGNDGISANAESTNNIINLDIQQPDHEDSYYDLQLEKKDASDNKQLAGVKFKVSNVKINNSDIKSNNNENAFSITSKETVSNVINEIYTNANDDSKNKIGKETQVLNSNDTTDTYTIEETESITGYEQNTIKTNLKFYKKNENSNIKNDHASVVFDTKNPDGNYVSGNELQITDGYFVSSLDSTVSTADERKVENLDNYINSLKNENVVIVYYAKGKISVQYYNKLEGTYSVVLNKYVNNRVSNDSSINFNISLYKNKNSNNEFSETDEIKEVQTKKGTVKLSDLTTAQSITDSLHEIFITENEIGKTYYYVLEETKTRNDLIKLDYKIVIPFKFVKDEYNEYVITNAEEKGFGLKNNEKIEIRNGGLIHDDENACYIIGESGLSLMQIMVNNFEKEGNYNLKLLKIKAKDGFTADLLSQLKNANSINDLNALSKSGARFIVRRTTRGGSSVSENARDITSEEGKVKDVYDGKIDINEDDMNFNPEYNEENGGDAKLDYGTSKFTIDEWSATGTGMKVNKAISNLEIETKLSRGTDKYSLTDVKVYDKTQNKEITADEAFTKYGLFVKIMNSEDGTPILITAVADDVITGEFSFNLKKVNSKTGKELTAEECNGMKFNFGLYQGGDSYDNPGTKVTELTKKDGTTVNISNLTTLQEINNAMSNIEITEEMNKQTTYRLIIEETEAPADFVKFNHKIGCTLISNQDENEEYKMIYTDFKVYDGKYWQYYSQYEEVDFNQTDSINTLTLTLKNVPKTGSYNLDVEKVDLSGNDIKDETTRFSVKAYSSLYNRTDGKFALEASSRIEIKDKKENILTATDGKSTELRDIQINKEDIGKTYYFVIEETDAPYQFTKLNYKIVVPITFSENENEYKASKGEAYAFVEDKSIYDSSYEDGAVYIKKSLSEVATSQKDTVTVEQNQDSTTINVKVPNKSEYTLKLKKVSAGTNEPLSNVQFNLIGAKINGTALKDSNNQEITTSHFEPVTTGTDGSVEICGNTSVPNPVSITSIESDEYYFTEETEPDGHRKLPDNVAIELLVKKGSDGKVNELNILVVNKNDKSIIQKGRYALTYIINEYGDTVTISAVKTADNEIILTVSDPEDTRNGNYNLYLLKKDNNNTVLSGVNFELIGAKVSNKEIISVDSPKDAKAIVTGTDKVSVYTNAKDENGNDVIQINNTNLEEDDEFILREKDLGSNNGYTQLPSNYKIKVKVQKSEGNNKYFVSGTTLELYNENNQIVSPKENTEDEYEINGVTYKISLEKSGSNIILTVENPKVNGEYKLNVIKKDINKQGYVSGFGSFGTNSVAGAKFNITLYKNVILNYKDFNIGSSFGNKVRFGSYTTKGTTEDLNHDNFKRTEITYSEIEQNRIDIWRIAETDPPTGFESMKNDLVLGIEKTYDEKTKQFYIDTIHIYQLNGDGTITWDPQSYEEINKADGSVMYTYVSSDNDTWQIMLNKDRTQIAVSADNIPNGEYRLNVMKKITDDNSAGDTADSAKSGASFNIQLYKDIDLNSSNFKFGSDNNPNNFENFTQDENEYISYETKGNAEDLTNDKFKRTGITTDSVGNKYDIWKINEWSAPDGLDTYSGQLVLGVKKKYNSDSHTFSIESITMYKVDGNGIKSSNNVWEAQTVHDVNNSNADSTEMNTYTTYSYFDTDSTGNNIRRWDFVIKNNSQIYVTLHNNPTEYGSYNVNLVKHDEYGNNISGVKFMAIREVNGGAPEAIYTEQNPLVTSYTNVNIGGTVNIDGTKVNTDDVYTLKELDLDENSEYTKIPGNIKLTVKKATRKNSNYSKTHYVERIQLRLVSDDGQKVITPTENLFNKQVIETTINGEKANITAELIDNTITITVVNPDKTGLYSLDLTKVEKGTNTPLDGAEFEVKYYNSMSTQNETESVNVLNSDGTISTIKTSEIKTVADFKKLQNIIVNESTAPFSYWIIKETKAPAGHDLLKYKIEIRIFKQSTSDGYKVSSDRARALYEDGTNKLLEDLTEDEPKTTITEDKESSTYKLNINVENAITPKGTYSLNLNKVDKATKSNLTGAEFEVSLKSGRTKIPSVTIVNDDNTETTIDLSTIKSVDDFNKLKNIKITSEGRFVWQIKETKAPEGFKKLDYYISIIFNSTNVNNNYVIKKVSADAIYESDGSYRSTPIEALDKNEPQTTITETTTGTYQANITIENNSYGGSYKLSLMKKNEADASHDIYSNGDDSRSALAGATFDVKLYKNIQKNNSNFEFNSQYNEENKGPYTTVGADDLSESNEIVRDGLTSNGYSTGDYYDIWKIEETSAPDGYVKMTSPLVLGVEKKYDSKTRTFTINDIYVYQKNSNGLKSDGGKWVVLPVTNKEGNTAHGEDGNAMVKNSTYIFEQDGNKWSLVLSADKTRMIVTAFDKKEEEGQYDLNIQKRSTSGEILNGVEFSLMSAKVNNETVKNSKGETATNEKFVTSSVGIANVPSLTSVPNPIKITDVDNADVYVFRETNLPESIKNKYAKLPDYVSIELTVNKGREEVDGKTQLVAKSVSVKVIDNRTKKEYVGNRNNMVEYSFESNGKTYTAQIKASISNNTVTLTVENPDIPPEGEYKLSLVKAGNDERLGGVKFNLISARVNNGTIQNGSSSVSEDNPIVITTNAQKPVGIWPTDGSSMKILSATSDEYILKEADLCNNNKYVKLPDNKLIKLVILKEETNNEFKVSSINMYVGNDTDGWEPATYIFNEAHNMIIEARSTVTDSKGNEFTISFARSGDNLTLTVEDPKEETTKYTVSKKWDDANKTDSRPDYVEFRLFGFAKNDAEAQKIYNDLNNSLQSKAYKMISSKIKDKSILQYKCTGDINVRADDGWQEATWYNLSKDYNYFAWEISDIDGYDITNAEVSNNNTKLTITNTKDTTKYTIQKVWAEGTEMPKNLEVRLYSFDKDSQDYNELVGYVNSKDYDKINEKVKTLTPSGQSVYLWADTNWSHTWGGLDKDRSYFAWEVDKDALVKYNITNAEISEEGTKMTITNTKPVSKFNLTLVKYEQGSDKTLSGALFEITIKDENGNPLKTVNGTEINKYQQTTSATYGRIGLDDLIIDGADKKYTVEITEVLAPAGYERIMDTISFQVTSKIADDGSYMLTPGDYTVANTKQCEVDESGNVIVTVEDKKTEKVEFAIYKKWENVNDTELPDSITVELYQVPENKLDDWNKVKGDANARQEYLYRGAYGTGGQVTLTKADALNGNNLLWYHKWTGLSKENTDTKVKNIYYVIETDGPEGFITTYEPNNYKSPDVNTVTITNTKETTQYTIQKVWDKNVQTSSMPRTLQVSLFAFNKNDENDTKLYNELIGYVNNKQYNEINNKIAELTDKKVGSSIGLSAGNQWSFTWSELSKDNNYFAWETDANALSKFNITNAVISDEGTKMTITNTQPEGSFKLKLIKKLTNTNITLANAKFTLSIKDEAGNELIPNTSYEYKTDANGEIVVDKLAITGPNKEYTVTIKETKAPAGYAKLTDEVSFKVKSHAKADGSGFELIANDLTPIKNAKDAKVTEDGIEVTIYNDLTSPHKGVKDIKNQDSGYYDNVTGKVYTSKEEVASTLHDWVIQTTIPEGITAYTTYEISDEINEKLVFAGLDTVKVKYVNGADLTKDKDYKVTYDEASRMLKVTFIDESFKGGYNLEVGKDVEIRFNTTFALDNDGNIIAINEEVPNQAKLTYGNDSNNKQTKLTEIPEVHTGGVGIYKYDKKTNKALEGAHFKIATSKENALAGIFVKDGNGQDIEKVTNSNGLAEFAGLEFGEDALNKAEYETYDSITGAKVYKYDTSKLSTTYYLVETESPKGYLKLEKPVEVVVKVGSYDMKDITSLVQVGNEEGIYDLSLRKFITAVKDTAKGTEEEVTSRIPQVDLTKLASGESTTATYTHPKDPVLVHTTDIVTYTIRIYNEGPQDAYASIVKDDIPDGLQFVQYTEGDGSLNAEYRWKLVDENDNEVTDVSKAKYIVTDYLSKEQDKTPGANLLKAYKPETMSELDYRDVKVQFKVTEPTTSDRILINYAQISKETDSSGRVVRDRDSTPNVWVEGEDDQDIEKVRVQYFDLALRKWVTQAIVTENGKTVVTQTGHKAEDDPEEVVKVDLKKSKINNVVVKFRYSIRITNEGEIAGEATEIRDDIPKGLKFVAEDNPDWREENGQIVTNKLEHTTLQPGESAEVEILLTWINSANNMGVMTNVAEINKDHNDYGAPDIDSTPGNNVPGEDDIDDAPVMLTVKTGSEYILYASIALSAIAVIAVGGKVIKKKVMRNI